MSQKPPKPPFRGTQPLNEFGDERDESASSLNPNGSIDASSLAFPEFEKEKEFPPALIPDLETPPVEAAPVESEAVSDSEPLSAPEPTSEPVVMGTEPPPEPSEPQVEPEINLKRPAIAPQVFHRLEEVTNLNLSKEKKKVEATLLEAFYEGESTHDLVQVCETERQLGLENRVGPTLSRAFHLASTSDDYLEVAQAVKRLGNNPTMSHIPLKQALASAKTSDEIDRVWQMANSLGDGLIQQQAEKKRNGGKS